MNLHIYYNNTSLGDNFTLWGYMPFEMRVITHHIEEIGLDLGVDNNQDKKERKLHCSCSSCFYAPYLLYFGRMNQLFWNSYIYRSKPWTANVQNQTNSFFFFSLQHSVSLISCSISRRHASCWKNCIVETCKPNISAPIQLMDKASQLNNSGYGQNKISYFLSDR